MTEEQEKEFLERITVNEQSSIRIGGETVLRFDPFHLKEAAHDADVIFITHAHYDHFSPDDLSKAAKPGTVYVFPASMKEDIAKLGIPDERQISLTPGEETEVRGIGVRAVPAYNRLKPFHPKGKGWLGYLVTVDGTTVYIAGDTDATAEAEAVRCTVCLLPIGGTYTMDAAAAARLADTIRPRFVIPTHYGTVVGGTDAYAHFAEKVRNAEVVEKLIFS